MLLVAASQVVSARRSAPSSRPSSCLMRETWSSFEAACTKRYEILRVVKTVSVGLQAPWALVAVPAHLAGHLPRCALADVCTLQPTACLWTCNPARITLNCINYGLEPLLHNSTWIHDLFKLVVLADTPHSDAAPGAPSNSDQSSSPRATSSLSASRMHTCSSFSSTDHCAGPACTIIHPLIPLPPDPPPSPTLPHTHTHPHRRVSRQTPPTLTPRSRRWTPTSA